jgi:hypothetical protein
MKENLGDPHHDHNLAKAQILAEKSPSPGEKSFTLFGVIVKVRV